MTFANTGRITAATGAEAMRVQSAIGAAASRTGVDFGYLLAQAKSESGLNPQAHAASSSAAGLFQFLDQSWLAIVRQHGAANGLGWAASAIAPKAGGGYTVADPAMRQAVMALREQPEASALMAGAYAADNAAGLQSALGRPATPTDLYMAHFLGLGGATQFLRAADSNPGAPAAALFPKEAAANRGIFYAGGTPRSLAEVKALMGAKLGPAAADASAAVAPTAEQAFDDAAAAFNGTAGAAPASELASTADLLNGRGPETRVNMLRPDPATARLAYLLLTEANPLSAT